jgi:ribonuclease P protein component
VGAEEARFGRLRRRSEFLEAATGQRLNARGFALQAFNRGPTGEPRFGFTVTKKTGNAVERVRIRRRLKEAIRTAGALPVREGHDYVLVARREALTIPFIELSAEIGRALAAIGSKPKRREPKRTEERKQPDAMKSADRL